VLTKWSASEARQRWADILDLALAGQWQVVAAQRRDPVLVARKAELADLLAQCRRFEPEVLHEDDGSVVIWLNELDVYGHGDSVQEAAADLIDSVREYVDDWDDLKDAPNHRDHLWHVRRLQLAEDDADLCRVLFGDELAHDLCRELCPA